MMAFFLEPFEYDFMQRALLICVLVGFTNGFLGAFVVLRRLALMADALSHSLLPGLAVAAIWFGLSPLGLLFGGLMAAGFVAVGGQLIARSSRLKDETAIACLYILAFALGIGLIKYAQVQVDLDGFLFGNILGVSSTDLWTSFAISTVTICTLIAIQRPLLLAMFEPQVARTLGIPVSGLLVTLIFLIVLAMLASLQAVGVLLSLGLLILPAATLYLLSDSYQVMAWGGAVLGVIGSVTGLILSYWADIPSGPAIILVLGAALLAAILFGPRYGIITRALRPRHLHEESLRRWGNKP